ncbi:MAG TPA: hypothetical protein VNT81_15260 [Vicinamibacterales bacterium]|nr:hypothetical protein [Vicinamibacterales bacterium]
MTNISEPQRGSSVRYVAAMVSLIASFVTILTGFIFMVRSLEAGGYGTSTNSLAIVWLGAGGGLLGLGIVLLIWELSVRHNVRH